MINIRILQFNAVHLSGDFINILSNLIVHKSLNSSHSMKLMSTRVTVQQSIVFHDSFTVISIQVTHTRLCNTTHIYLMCSRHTIQINTKYQVKHNFINTSSTKISNTKIVTFISKNIYAPPVNALPNIMETSYQKYLCSPVNALLNVMETSQGIDGGVWLLAQFGGDCHTTHTH